MVSVMEKKQGLFPLQTSCLWSKVCNVIISNTEASFDQGWFVQILARVLSYVDTNLQSEVGGSRSEP